ALCMHLDFVPVVLLTAFSFFCLFFFFLHTLVNGFLLIGGILHCFTYICSYTQYFLCNFLHMFTVTISFCYFRCKSCHRGRNATSIIGLRFRSIRQLFHRCRNLFCSASYFISRLR